MLKSKKIFIFFISFFVLIFFFAPIFAQSIFHWKPEVKYPTITTSQTTTITISTTTDIVKYIQYIFNFAILIAVIAAISSLIYGGFLYITSGDNPQQLTNAKSQIISAFLGLIIILSSHLLFTVLNPSLTMPNLPQLVGLEEGFILKDNGNEIKSAISLPNVQKIYGSNFLPTYIEILPKSIGKIRLEVYSEPYYKGAKKTTDNELNPNFEIKSVKIISLIKGVYLYGPPGRKAGVLNKIYFFPSPAIKGDEFKPTKYLFPPWLENGQFQFKFSTTSIPEEWKKVILKPSSDNNNKIEIFESEPDIQSISDLNLRWLEIPSSSPYIKATAFAGKNFTSSSETFAFDLNNLSGTTRFNIKSVKIDTIITPYDYCPQPIHIISSETGYKGNFTTSQEEISCLKNISGAPIWVYTTSTQFSSILGATDIDIADFSKDPAFTPLNDNVFFVMLKNKINENKQKETDFGVIISEDPNFSGMFKIFLENRKNQNVSYPHEGNVPWDNPETTTTESYTPLMMSHKPTKWGKVLRPSSMRVFNINPDGECEITLYKLKEFQAGESRELFPCVIRINKNNPPIYYPKYVNNLCREQGDGKFEDNVYSIKIDGRCIVALSDLKP
ncbi:MAG: pilin, partial [Minisyncoccia bacterium]